MSRFYSAAGKGWDTISSPKRLISDDASLSDVLDCESSSLSYPPRGRSINLLPDRIFPLTNEANSLMLYNGGYSNSQQLCP